VEQQSNPAVVAADASRNVRYWWVNQKTTHRQELEGEFLWSPQKKQGSASGESSNNMTKIMPGDVVFSFSLAEGALRAVGVALGRAREAPNPFAFGTKRKQLPAQRGWRVTVRFAELAKPLQPKDHLGELTSLLPGKHSPIRASGNGNQGIYLASVPQKMAATLRRLLHTEVDDLIERITQSANSHLPDDAEEEAIQQRTDIGPLEKVTLMKARRGQGVYRANLERVEAACRVTGLLDRRHLRATHIKPWCKSNDAEKLDGFNGLLLSPHLEHLFSRGYVSFSDAGELLGSRYLNPAVLEKWGLQLPRQVRAFGAQQCQYLDYHRREVFEHHVGGRRKPHETDVEEVHETEPDEPVTVYGE
jgi:putative restriction endonuclease